MPVKDFDSDIEEGVLSIKRTSEDKLTYKNIIAERIRWCCRYTGNMYYRDSCIALESIIYFDIRGYKLRKELDKIKLNLKRKRAYHIKNIKSKMGRRFYTRPNQAKLRLLLNEWYWNQYFRDIIQLLASNNLLLETEKNIPIQETGNVSDDDTD